MKIKTLYQCEYCDCETTNVVIMEKHERAHKLKDPAELLPWIQDMSQWRKGDEAWITIVDDILPYWMKRAQNAESVLQAERNKTCPNNI